MGALTARGQEAFLTLTRFAAPQPIFGGGAEPVTRAQLQSAGFQHRPQAIIPHRTASTAFIGAVACAALLRTQPLLRGQARRRQAWRRNRSCNVARCAQRLKKLEDGTAPRRPRRRTKRRTSCSAAEAGAMPAVPVAEPVPMKGLSIAEVQRSWEVAEELGKSPKDIANSCSWLACVQRQLGYFAALHEGAVGNAEVVSRAPPLPLILTWEGPEGTETYGTSLAEGGGVTASGPDSTVGSNGNSSLLEQLLVCSKEAENDKRFGQPGGDSSRLQVRVSLMQGFEDISESPLDWVPGEHGLWYSGPEASASVSTGASCVYLPKVAERLAAATPVAYEDDDEGPVEEMFSDEDDMTGDEEEDEEDEDEEEYDIEDLKRVLEALVTRGSPVEEGEELPTVEKGILPQGGKLFRFASHEGICSVSKLPTFKIRDVTAHHVRLLLIAQARLQVEEGLQGENGELAEFAALMARDVSQADAAEDEDEEEAEKPAASEPSVRAFIVPFTGAYSNAHLRFTDRLASIPNAKLDNVKRIFVVAPVWDCYIDGCGLPERRCAAYGDIELDMVTLEVLRKSDSFAELNVEQDMRERSIEALLPIVKACVGDRKKPFMLVPILVGGLVWRKAEVYTKLLAPYLSDPENLFVVSGDVNELGDELDIERTPSAADSPARWMRDLPTVSTQDEAEQLVPVFDALELFLAVLAQIPQGQELRLQRY